MLTESQADLQSKNAELARLEGSLANSVNGGGGQPNSLSSLQSSMQNVLTEMTAGSIQHGHISETQELMDRLFVGLQNIAAQSQSSSMTCQQTAIPSVIQLLQAQAQTHAQVAGSEAGLQDIPMQQCATAVESVEPTSPTNPGALPTAMQPFRAPPPASAPQ